MADSRKAGRPQRVNPLGELRSRQGGNDRSVEVEYYTSSDLDERVRHDLARRLYPLVRLAFGSFDSSIDNLERSFETNSHLSICTSDDGQDFGFMFSTELNGPSAEVGFWLSKIAIRADSQGQGLGSLLAQRALVRSAATWMGCTTQNPSAVRLVQKLCLPPVWPLDEPFAASSRGRELLAFVRTTGQERARADEQGVVRALYTEGRLGVYPDRSELTALRNLMAAVSLDADRGDAIVVLGQLDRKALSSRLVSAARKDSDSL